MTTKAMRILFHATQTKAEPWLEGLRAALPHATVDIWESGAPQADHAVVWAPPQQFIDEQPKLRGLFNIGAGVDALLKLKLPPDLLVVRLDDAGMAVQMAEFVCHAVIRHFRELDAYAIEKVHAKWSFRKPNRRANFTVGIMGLGVLGQRVAQALQHFDFPVRGYSRTPKDVPGVECFSGAEQFQTFLAGTRILVCLLPLTPHTSGILNRETFAAMPAGGYLINVARGEHLVEADLLEALASGQLAGATLDVFTTEPLPPDHPFWPHPKIVVTPHTSARTLREDTIAQIVGKIEAVERGRPIRGVVDRGRGY